MRFFNRVVKSLSYKYESMKILNVDIFISETLNYATH